MKVGKEMLMTFRLSGKEFHDVGPA